jgi:hypothetical protein
VFFVVTHAPDPKAALVVETVPRIDEATIAELKRRMFSSGCPNGLLFDDSECVIVRDTYTSMDVASLVEEKRVPTDRLPARVISRESIRRSSPSTWRAD